MRVYGKKKISTKVDGHQNCSICHPSQKNKTNRARQESKIEIEKELMNNDKYYMTIAQVRDAIKSADLTMVASNVGTVTLYLKVDMNDLDIALTNLLEDGIEKIAAYLAQPSNVLYIGD